MRATLREELRAFRCIEAAIGPLTPEQRHEIVLAGRELANYAAFNGKPLERIPDYVQAGFRRWVGLD